MYMDVHVCRSVRGFQRWLNEGGRLLGAVRRWLEGSTQGRGCTSVGKSFQTPLTFSTSTGGQCL